MDNYKIFAELKNKNIKREKIIELFSQISKEVNHITDLQRHNKDLLFFACFNDNETLFEYLTENYQESFQSTYKECIFFTYINRSPKILEIALNALLPLTKEEKIEYINRFSLNCYRKENIEIVTKWINKTLDVDEKMVFIIKLYENHNKPFLEHVSTDLLLKDIVLNISLNNSYQVETQNYLKRYSSHKHTGSYYSNKESNSTEIIENLNSENNQSIVELDSQNLQITV